MGCDKCWLEDPKKSKFCKYCGDPLGIRLRCSQCGAENPSDSLFCIVCGAGLLQTKKSGKGTQRKCTSCGHFNQLEAAYCVICGGKMIRRVPNENLKPRLDGPSFKTIGLVIGVIFFLAVLVKAGTIFFKAESSPGILSSSTSASKSINVDEAQVIAVAKNFKCACGRCGELPLVTCQCEMAKGSAEEKRFIRERLGEGYTVEQVIELLDKKYGHRV